MLWSRRRGGGRGAGRAEEGGSLEEAAPQLGLEDVGEGEGIQAEGDHCLGEPGRMRGQSRLRHLPLVLEAAGARAGLSGER